jgi:hypothetical protein
MYSAGVNIRRGLGSLVKKTTRSDDVMSQNYKRAKIKDTFAINEEEGAFAPQPYVPNKIRVISPVEVSERQRRVSYPLPRPKGGTQG